MLTFQATGSWRNSVPGDPRSPCETLQGGGLRVQSSLLQRLRSPAGQGWLRVRLLSLTSASFFLAMAPAPTPRRCIPALGPRATPLPGPRVSASRDPPPAPERGSAVITSSPRAGSYAPTSCRGPAGIPGLEAWAPPFVGGRAPRSRAAGKARCSDAEPYASGCGREFHTRVDALDAPLPVTAPPPPPQSPMLIGRLLGSWAPRVPYRALARILSTRVELTCESPTYSVWRTLQLRSWALELGCPTP